MRLILFDIDGTLIFSDSAGRAAMVHALQTVFGATGPIADYKMSGKTDPLIITDLMLAAGVPAAEVKARLPDVYALMVQHSRAHFVDHEIVALPGVLPLLTALSGRPEAVLGLLTGNISDMAPLKLAAAGIEPGLFRIGAYGSDEADRNRLPAVAMRRATDVTGYPFSGADTVIIGDTPADILCARAGKATAVAVATGIHSAATLAQYQPDYLLDNLADTTAVLNAIFPGYPAN